MDKNRAQKILEDNDRLWNEIAYQFSLTRKFNWPEIVPLANYAKEKMRVLDLGCGNGRFFSLLKDKGVNYTGIDSSSELIKAARDNFPASSARFVMQDALNLSFEHKSFDLIYALAVLHIIPSRDLRLKFLKNVQRILKKDGKIILTVWCFWQKKYLPLIIKFSLLKLLGKSKLDWKDLYLPWQNKYNRYYHAFTLRELKKLFRHAGFIIEKAQILKRNQKRTNLLIVARINPNALD